MHTCDCLKPIKVNIKDTTAELSKTYSSRYSMFTCTVQYTYTVHMYIKKKFLK